MDKETIKIEMNMPPPPNGYEYTGEFRCPKNGEHFINNFGCVARADILSVNAFPILRKKRWRAGYGLPYYTVSEVGKVRKLIERDNHLSDLLYEIGNYFSTQEQAQEAASKIRDLLMEIKP